MSVQILNVGKKEVILRAQWDNGNTDLEASDQAFLYAAFDVLHSTCLQIKQLRRSDDSAPQWATTQIFLTRLSLG